MDNQVLARVAEAYEQRQAENRREEDRRLREIAQNHPDLDRLLGERHQMILRAARGAFAGGVPTDPERAMEEYNRKIAALLAEKGYPSDYLSPVCACPLCGDTGYVYEGPVMRRCACFQAAYEKALAEAGQGREEKASFARFDEARFPDLPLPGTDVTQREYMRVVRDRCEKYALGVPEGPVKTLLLHGGSGLGKTFLLECVETAAREKGVDALYTTAYDLLNALKNAYFSRAGESAREYFDAPLLLIDDLGMEPLMENITVEQIYNLLNARLSQGLYTAVSTNLSREELRARYTERVSSRLLDTRTGMAIFFQGRDIRLTRA
ncbi:MAG: ATP-binding protein [Clostridia bacterium]|nr:ATP-binding protein [Clostridia bacterium]